ncbi:hypothetical protein [Salinibacter ruber]|jgi:hypothetical protein|uniref:Uncharacterized protein n=1 Tax=Salinibacter ruber TaxID=146919 RepID=A0A9X2UK36_9BACT|nr:hypothetical protein [Salinibacter ruber]MBB4089863.1 hypothetical protein [Salinibacter ruber]MCS3613908.1 hypothetical protein [Salinibacter ruber]MCS4036089.1 hypothetical protein [Salinibacter ruber]MCS4199099.1 hypothetical protein [Salinibacter ruber]
MLDRLLGRVHDTKHAAPILRGYLWWGLLLRAVLLLALGTLLVVEGNVLAEWLLTVRPPALPQEDVEELTAVSYTVIVVLLMVGTGARWQLLRRLEAAEAAPESAPSSAEEAPPLGR